jgi:hypothetical protein
MATLTGRAPKDTYGDLLQVSNANDGVDSTLRFLSDGKGTNSSFKISSSDAQFTSTLTSTGLLTTTAGIVSGSDIISDTDSTDDLGSTGVRWANLWVDNITMGGTIAGAVATFSSTLTVTGLTTIASLKGTGAVTITDILDEDNMASDSATVLATQQSIKAYVDAQVGTVDTLSEVLAIGNTSGATDLVMNSGQKVTTNTIDETTAASGVTIDSVLVKDSTVTAGTLTIGAGSVTDSSGAISFGNENLLTTGTLGSGALTATTIAGTTGTFSGDVLINGSNATFAGNITAAGTIMDFGSGQYPVVRVNATSNSAIFGYSLDGYQGGANTGRDWRMEQGRSAAGEFNLTDITAGNLVRFKINSAGAATFAGAVSTQALSATTGAFSSNLTLSGTFPNITVADSTTSLDLLTPGTNDPHLRLFRNKAPTLNDVLGTISATNNTSNHGSIEFVTDSASTSASIIVENLCR